ncbi:unnamed protein product [Leptosia nina]|uniref:Beta-glucosidase n=1 Tax=Leptosia nina TaxID=320188 RepID=A0AAV1J7J6_9NEOP
MLRVTVLILLVITTSTSGRTLKRDSSGLRQFPDGFRFGTATASYQVEGAWNVDGKTENIWDRLSHTKPCVINNCDTGDVADNSYYNYKRDVEMMRELGLDFYRFSISWSRLLPTSFPDSINDKAVDYYNNLINEMLKYNIEPMVTIYHWDLPQKLQDLGGWTNPNIVDWFSDYSRILFTLFGDRVGTWFTINEPREVCYQGYAASSKAPNLNITGYAEYHCAKNLLVSNAKVYHMYHDEFSGKGGKIGIVFSSRWLEPESKDHNEAANDVLQFELGQYAHPIFSENGDWPQVMKDYISAKSAAQGFYRSRLPQFTAEEVALIKGSSDFFGLNHYTTSLVYRNESLDGLYSSPSYYDDMNAGQYQPSNWVGSYPGTTWLKVVPWGFRKLLNKIREEYGNPPVYITENGCATGVGLMDDNRVAYYKAYLASMMDAMDEGCDVQLYTAWSLMDNFEWYFGYDDRFGFYEVDYNVEGRTRTPRKSAYFYKELLRTRRLDSNYDPDTVIITVASTNRAVSGGNVRTFPKDFLFGAATAAYQIEGAWNEDGKSESIWDRISHTIPCIVKNCDTGDIAANSYHNYKRDVEMIRELGLDFYRFSIAWTRILPTSFPDKINQAGVNYYNNLINELLKYNITPMVTVYHFDLPRRLEDLGGWTNPNIADWFSDYARVIFELFGDRVKTWFTINEPREICIQGYGLQVAGTSEYICSKNMLLAHAKAYHIYNKEYRPKQGGTIGIVLNAFWHEPETEKDIEAAEDMRQFDLGQYAHPIFSETGGWPQVMKERIAAKSAEQGFFRSRLPDLSPQEVELIRGTSDFFGINHYTTTLVYRNDSVQGYHNSPSYYDDVGIISYQPETWESTRASWLKVVPWGFYKLLNKIRDDYGNPAVYVTENGCSSELGLLDDQRVSLYKNYLSAMLDSIAKGSNIRAYTAWSLMDNFEWHMGYHDNFGIYEVDFESPERTRTPRKSAYLYREIVKSRRLNMDLKVDMTVPMKAD